MVKKVTLNDSNTEELGFFLSIDEMVALKRLFTKLSAQWQRFDQEETDLFNDVLHSS